METDLTFGSKLIGGLILVKNFYIVLDILFLQLLLNFEHIGKTAIMHITQRTFTMTWQFNQNPLIIQTNPTIFFNQLSPIFIFLQFFTHFFTVIICYYVSMITQQPFSISQFRQGLLYILIKLQETMMQEKNQKEQKSVQQMCPYLSTIRKNLLDFDFQKICCVTLTHTNIYICLICGRYFQGRSSTSPAYQHSIEFSHFIFMNLDNSRIFCLPDDYEVQGYTLKDIKQNLKPTFDWNKFDNLQKIEEKEYNVDGKQFWPGVIGVNNLGKTDFATSVVYLLNSVKQIRRFFVLGNVFQDKLVSEFATLLKKIWNPLSFKGVVSPHQFLQAITDASSKKFKIGTQSDPSTFLLWLIDNLTKGLKKSQPKLQPQKLFKGMIKTSIINGIKDSYQYQQIPSKIESIPFSTLRLQFPQKGIFNKSQNQIHLLTLLQKYTGKQAQKHQKGLRFAKIIQFPCYLILVFKRFASNGYTVEKDNSCLLYKSQMVIESDGKKGVYGLNGQICHTGDYLTGRYKAVVFMEEANKWFEIEDLQVKQVVQKQVLLYQPYIQVYKLQRISHESQKTKTEKPKQ